MDFLFSSSQWADFLATTLRLSMPLIFAAVGGVICEKSGVFNIALEGCILSGAFGAALGALYLGSPMGGVLLAILCASLAGIILAILCVSLGVNQMVAGIAVNTLMLGLTSFLSRYLLDGTKASMTLPGFDPINIPILSSIPVIGPVLFEQDLMVYAMYLMVPATWWLLYRTPWGLNIRAIGEYPRAADTAGINVQLTRYFSVIAGSLLAGLGGAYIVLSQVHVFTEDMSAGKGFIALAALILGRWNPVGALLAALLFGFFDALQLRLQFNSPEIPYQLFSMLPYLVSVLALVLFSAKVRPPAAAGHKFERGAK